MATFETWSQDSLIQFAVESTDDRKRLLAENITLANAESTALQCVKALMTDYAELCDHFCKKPQFSDAYRKAQELLR